MKWNSLHIAAIAVGCCDILLRYKTNASSDSFFMAVVIMVTGARIVEAIEK